MKIVKDQNFTHRKKKNRERERESERERERESEEGENYTHTETHTDAHIERERGRMTHTDIHTHTPTHVGLHQGTVASRCFPYPTLSLASGQTLKDLKRSQGLQHGGEESGLGQLVLQISPKFTTGVKYQFHQDF